MAFKMKKCSYSPLHKRGDKSGTSEGSISEEGYNRKTTYRESKSGDKIKRKELTKVRHKKEQSSESTLGQENYSPESDYTTTLKKYNRKGELKSEKSVSGDKTKKHKKLRKKYYRGNKKVTHTT